MAVIASLVAALLAALSSRGLATRWRQGRTRPSLLAWSIALAMLAIASAALLLAAAIGFNEPLYRLFSLFGAVLDVVWLALGSVLVNSRDRVATRWTGVATLLVGLALLPGAVRGEPMAVPGAVLGITWGLLLLDGHRTRVRVGSSLVVVAWSLLATSLVLPAPFTQDLPAMGLPETTVLPAFVRGFALGGDRVGSVVAIVGGLVAIAHLVWRYAGRVGPETTSTDAGRGSVGGVVAAARSGWPALGPAGMRDLAVGNLLVAVGVAVLGGARFALAFLPDTVAVAVSIGLAVVVMYPGFTRTGRPVGSPRPTSPRAAPPPTP